MHVRDNDFSDGCICSCCVPVNGLIIDVLLQEVVDGFRVLSQQFSGTSLFATHRCGQYI